MNQSSNLNEFVEIAQKKFPSFVIVAFNSAEVWSNTNVLMDCYSSPLSHLKGLKLFIILKLLTTKSMEIYFHLVVLAILPLQLMKKINRNLLSLNVVNAIEYGMNCDKWDKGGTKIKVLPAMCEKKNDLEEHL